MDEHFTPFFLIQGGAGFRGEGKGKKKEKKRKIRAGHSVIPISCYDPSEAEAVRHLRWVKNAGEPRSDFFSTGRGDRL